MKSYGNALLLVALLPFMAPTPVKTSRSGQAAVQQSFGLLFNFHNPASATQPTANAGWLVNFTAPTFPREASSVWSLPWPLAATAANTGSPGDHRFWLATEGGNAISASVTVNGRERAMSPVMTFAWIGTSYPPPNSFWTYVETDPTLSCASQYTYSFHTRFGTPHVSFEGTPHIVYTDISDVYLPPRVVFKGNVRGWQFTKGPFTASVNGNGAFLLYYGPVGGVAGAGHAFDGSMLNIGVVNTAQNQITVVNQSSTPRTIQRIGFVNPPSDPTANAAGAWTIIPSSPIGTGVTLACGQSYSFALNSLGQGTPAELEVKTTSGNLRLSLYYVDEGG